jgi:hypothetical protein
MYPIPNLDPIEFLLNARFPHARKRRSFPSGDRNIIAKIDAYEAELKRLTSDQILSLVERERTRMALLVEEKAKREEQERFFNLPGASADYSHWSRSSYWSLDEAVALSFGRAPELVNWKTVQPYARVSPFAFAYGRLRDLVLRAQTMGQLFDPALPGFYLAWARRNDIAYPIELENRIKAMGILVADWKTRCDDLEKHFLSEREAAAAQLARTASQLEAVAAENAKLRRLVPDQDLGKASEKTAGRPLATRERESLLKLVIGMAMKGYSYDPDASRSPSTAEIATDLDQLVVSLVVV